MSVALYSRDLPPRSTLFDYFQRWEYDGTLLRIHYELYQKCRERVDRQALICLLLREIYPVSLRIRVALLPNGANRILPLL